MNGTLISLLDNASDGDDNTKKTANASSRMAIGVDTSRMTATLVEQYIQPEGRIAVSKGNFHFLPNRNLFLGWGSAGGFSEHPPNGKDSFLTPGSSVRAIVRSNHPLLLIQPPGPASLHIRNNARHLLLYVSWNGTTEIRSWRIWTGNSNNGTSAFAPVGVHRKSGFDTGATQFYKLHPVCLRRSLR